MSPIFDYDCDNCGSRTESIRPNSVTRIRCKCGNMAYRIISATGVHCGNGDDTTWARDAVEVMPKDSNDPAVRQFIKDPTKRNLTRAMKSQGIRHMDHGEKTRQRQEFDLEGHTRKVMERKVERERVEVHG